MTDPNEQVEKATQAMISACNEVNAMASDSVSAFVQSTSAMTRGCEQLSRELGEIAQDSMTRTLNAGKAIMGARTLREMMDMQAEFMRTFLDSWMTGTSRVSEISARCAQEAFEPVAKQVNHAVNKAAQQANRTAAA